ncbi:MAG: NrfD/PsrC family molybdoenzyme membrane anchor subunit [Chloroflexota bacterium]
MQTELHAPSEHREAEAAELHISPSLAVLKDVLWMIVVAGAVAGVLRFALGLGYTTGLNDSTPWGLWIAFKLGFVALAGGGFTLAGLVYVFHLESYHSILRRAILIALLGYGSFIVSLIFDLGLPWHIYMPVIHWQHHSVMFEIAWCVMLYFSVLLMEFGPVILEYPWFQNRWFQLVYKLLRKSTVFLVIAGIVLSTLHQSSLGALFLIMPQRVHPLWYSPWIPPLFFISAIAAGLMALVLEGYLSERLFGKSPDEALLGRLAHLAAFVLWVYLAVRLGDLLWRGVLPVALDLSWQSLLFMAEILLGGVLPGLLLMSPALRAKRVVLITSGILVVAGVLSQRMALSMFAMARPQGVPYMPSLLEILIAFAIPAAAVLVYLFFAENLAVLQSRLPVGAHNTRPFASLRPVIIRRSAMAIFVLAALAAVLPFGSPAGAQSLHTATPVKPAAGWKVDGQVLLFIDGDHDGDGVFFPHDAHQARLAEDYGEAAACQACHHASTIPQTSDFLKKSDVSPAESCSQCHQDFYQPTSIFDHARHQQALGGNAACQECHAGQASTLGTIHTRQSAANCQECHISVAPLAAVMAGDAALLAPQGSFAALAPAYLDAMHGICLACHLEQANVQNDPALGECATCHSSQPATIR